MRGEGRGARGDASTALDGEIAIVTGASRGIGRHVAVALAAQGASVALVARGADALAATEHAIRAAGSLAVAFPCDVSRPDAVETLREQVLERLGTPTILVNGAGVFGPIGQIRNTDPAGWIDTLMLNTVAPFLTARAFVDGMIAAGWGRIVNVSSAASLDPPGGLNSAYATSKVALNHFTRHLAAELAGTGVTANVIHPGDVKTEMWADIRDQVALLGPEVEGYRNWVQWVDATGGDPPAKATALILRLMGEEAAEITGQFLWIEDGLRPPLPTW